MTVRTIPVKSILTKSNLPVCDFSVNPYVGCEHACKYCYASFMKRFTDHPEPWGEFVDAKEWPPLCGAGRYAGREAFIGSVTDPYQPCEEKSRRTRALLEQLAGSGMKISIQTKSDLVLRDLDLIRRFPDARVGFSVVQTPKKLAAPPAATPAPAAAAPAPPAARRPPPPDRPDRPRRPPPPGRPPRLDRD